MYTKLITLGASIAVTATGLLLTTPPAFGKTPIVVNAPEDIATRRISYADLNLASVPGERTLSHRVHAGVNSFCSDVTGAPEVAAFSNSPRCRSSAWNQARPQMSRAIQRARELASTGISSIAASAIVISVPE